MSDPSTGLALLVVVLGGLAGAIGLAGWLAPRPWLARAGTLAGWATAATAVFAWAVRFALAGHLPLFGTYESALSLAAAVLLAPLLARPRGARSPGIWPFACLVAAALLAHGLRYDPTVYALTISERSWVVDVHAVVAWAAFGALAANAGFALLRLLVRDAVMPAVDRATSLSLSVGFVLHSGMLASGSLYKFLLFGRAWSFDPIETLGFVAWVAYGTLLHMHLFAGWSGRRLARWSVGLFVILVVSYRGIVYFPSWSTYHIFDMDLRMHLTGAEQVVPGASE